MAQRLVRAKAKIRDAGIPFKVPDAHDLTGRLSSVLAVIYLIFNEGYFSSSGGEMIRQDLATKAIELAGVLADLMPDESEVGGLLALMLFHDSRRAARVDTSGDVILLKDQDRGLWDAAMIEKGRSAMLRSRRTSRSGKYLLQAEIALEHINGQSDPDWTRVVGIYDQLALVYPAPVVLLNRAVAVGEAKGAAEGLRDIETLDESLSGYHAYHAARAHFLSELSRVDEARDSYLAALALVDNEPERRFLQKRLEDLPTPAFEG
jgi:RNA polymerase sigma-70 factor (ECF subfamily)